MNLTTKAIEANGMIDAQRRLLLEEPLPIAGPTRVRVIILLPDETDIDEMEWLRAAALNPAFDFLKAPEEDIYSLEDGRSFHF
jgi:hypothetical protein